MATNLCAPVNQEDFETLNILASRVSRQAGWRLPDMMLVREDERGKILRRSDAPWLGGHTLLLRPKAQALLGSLVKGDAEFLPLSCGGEDVALLNVTRLVDALDEAASSIVRFSTGRVMDIEQYGFRADRIQPHHVFKIPNLRLSPTFVDETIVTAWTSALLQGISFRVIWST